MKSHRIITILAIAGIAAFYFAGYQPHHSQPAAIGAEQVQTPAPTAITIGIAQDAPLPGFDQIKLGIQDELKTAGYVEGKDFTYNFENAQGQAHRLDQRAMQHCPGDEVSQQAFRGTATKSACSTGVAIPIRLVLLIQIDNPLWRQFR